MKQFKLRASQAAKLATMPRAKKDIEAGLLGQTSISYVQEWMISQIYGRFNQIHSKYIDKGILCENEAIQLLAEHQGFKMKKNTEYFEDDFFTGTPDLITADSIYDTKCSWDEFSFPLFETNLDKTYYYQMQVYMHLTGLKKAYVAYVLVNTPEELLYGLEPYDYSFFPIDKRVKLFPVDYNSDDIDFLQSQVIKARNYIKTWNY